MLENKNNAEEDGETAAAYVERAHRIVSDKLEEKYNYHPLESIFAKVNLGLDELADEVSDKKYYKPGEMNIENVFPVKKEDINSEALESTGKAFEEEFASIFEQGQPEFLEKNITSLIEKYGWPFPEKKENSTALVDHVHLTAAVATMLYRADKAGVKKDNKFKLIAGDLSGIQNYIYEIANIGEGGVAKRLKARSFFVTILSEGLLGLFLEELNLPQASKILATGGKFYLLAENTSRTDRALEELHEKINNWFIEKFQAELYFNLKSVKFSEEDLSDFGRIYEKANEKLEENKVHKYSKILGENQGFKLEKNYDESSDYCNSCQKLWAVEDELCPLCRQDLEIGSKLRNCDYIAFNFGQNVQESKEDLAILPDDSINIYLEEELTNDADFDHVLNIKDNKIDYSQPMVLGNFSNYVPYFEDENYKRELCAVCKQTDCQFREIHQTPLPYLFGCMGALSASERQKKGKQFLGVLKADVDRLGHIFSIGLGWENVNYGEIKSLSRMTDYYFSKILPEKFRQAEKVSYSDCRANLGNNYIVYGGGDDLLVVGPWDNLITTAFYIEESFRKYTASNDHITLSAGMSLVKPNYPIARSSGMAGEEEERAKSSGRDSFSIFGEAKKWDVYRKLLPLADLLDKALHADYISNSFLKRLSQYSFMEKEFQKSNDPQKRKWKSYFEYDIGRNFPEEDLEKNPELKEFIEKLKNKFVLGTDGVEGAKNFKLPYHWAGYRNRQEEE